MDLPGFWRLRLLGPVMGMRRAARVLGETRATDLPYMDTAPSLCAPSQGRGLGPSPLASASPSNLPSQSSYKVDGSLPHPQPFSPPLAPSLWVSLSQTQPHPSPSPLGQPLVQAHHTRLSQPPSLSTLPSTSTALGQCQSQIHPFRAFSGPPAHPTSLS